jgi:CubicO group peptidase (beta-lactamase class C family)
MQQLLTDMLSEPFPLIMKRLVLGPAGMSLSTYEQPLPGSRSREAASGHYSQGKVVRGNWHIYPEMAAAGLWTTPTELAGWALDIAGDWNGNNRKLLSKSMAAQMMTVQKPPSGLGILLEGKDKVIGFTHGGGNEGFRSDLVMYPAEGKGAVMMTNANQGSSLIGEVFTGIAAEYRWPGRLQSGRDALVLETGQINSIVGTYTAPDEPTPFVCEVSCEGTRLFIRFEDISLKTEIYAASAREFFTANGLALVFTRDSTGRATKMKIADLEATRQPED